MYKYESIYLSSIQPINASKSKCLPKSCHLSPSQIDVVPPLHLHLLVLRALGVDELLDVGAGRVVEPPRGGGAPPRRRGGEDGAGGAPPCRLVPRLAARAARRVHRQPPLQ